MQQIKQSQISFCKILLTNFKIKKYWTGVGAFIQNTAIDKLQMPGANALIIFGQQNPTLNAFYTVLDVFASCQRLLFQLSKTTSNIQCGLNCLKKSGFHLRLNCVATCSLTACLLVVRKEQRLVSGAGLKLIERKTPPS